MVKLIVTVLLAFALVGCGASSEVNGTSVNTTSTNSTVVSTNSTL